MRIVSLFANIGVAEAYLKELGFEVKVANELIPERAALYQSIYPETKMICGSITDAVTFDDIVSQCKKDRVDIVLATPPCQGMSTAGKQDKDDVRNHLFMYAIDVIKAVGPKYFMFENVTALMNTFVKLGEKVELIPDVISRLLGEDYDISFNPINASNYGVPQSRGRVIILGTKKSVRKKWNMPMPEEYQVTMRDAIGDLPIVDPFIRDISEQQFKKIFPHYEERRNAALAISPWHVPPSHVFRQVVVMQHTPTGATAFDNPEQFLPRKKDGNIVHGFHNTYKRQNWDTPAYTIAMDNIEISSQNNVHPGRLIGEDKDGYKIYSDPRALTLYELMKLMTIPDTWPLPTNIDRTLLRRVIGEGVPSLLVRKIFEQLL